MISRLRLRVRQVTESGSPVAQPTVKRLRLLFIAGLVLIVLAGTWALRSLHSKTAAEAAHVQDSVLKAIREHQWDKARTGVARFSQLEPSDPRAQTWLDQIDKGSARDRKVEDLRSAAGKAIEARNWTKADSQLKLLMSEVPGDREAVEMQRLVTEGRKQDLIPPKNSSPPQEDLRAKESGARKKQVDKLRTSIPLSIQSRRWTEAQRQIAELLLLVPRDPQAAAWQVTVLNLHAADLKKATSAQPSSATPVQLARTQTEQGGDSAGGVSRASGGVNQPTVLTPSAGSQPKKEYSVGAPETATARNSETAISPQAGTPATRGGEATVIASQSVVYQKPVVDEFFAPSQIGRGDQAILRWSVTGAYEVSIDAGIGAVPPSGDRRVQPSDTTTYVLTAKGLGGSVTASRTVTVTRAVEVAAAAPLLTSPPPFIPTVAAEKERQRADLARLAWVVDNETRLMWTTERKPGAKVHEKEAAKYCSDLRVGGHNDWRLPVLGQLQQIRDPSQESHVRIGIHIDPGVSSNPWYWSATKGAGGHWMFNILNGQAVIVEKDWYARTLCVRSAAE